MATTETLEILSKVFIVNKAGHDFSSATKYGELVPVTTGNMNIFRPDRGLYQIQNILEEFDPMLDYLLLSGNVFTNALAVSTVIAFQSRKCLDVGLRFLVYDAKNHCYLCHTLKRNDKGELYFKRSKDES